MASSATFLEVQSVKVQITCSRMSLKVPLQVEFEKVKEELKEAAFVLPTSFKSVLYSLTVDITTSTDSHHTTKQQMEIGVIKLTEANQVLKEKKDTKKSVGLVQLLNERQDAIILRIGTIPAHSELQATFLFCVKPSAPLAVNTFHFSIETAYRCFVGRDTDSNDDSVSRLRGSMASINQLIASRTKIESFIMNATASCGVKGVKAVSSTHKIVQDGLPSQIDGGSTTVIRYRIEEPPTKSLNGRFEVEYTLPELTNVDDHSYCIVVNEEKNRQLFKKRTLHSVLWKHRMPVASLHPVDEQTLEI
jgi:hypothetical protein